MALNLKVIGAGLGRTGTTSLKEALAMLLGGNCFHFLEFKFHPELMKEWLDFTQREDVLNDVSESEWLLQWEKLLPNYSSCVDEPASWYWKELWELFPDALVILSTRDSRSWWESVESVTMQIQNEKGQPELLSETRKEYLKFLFDLYPGLNEELSRGRSVNQFEEHNQRVLAFAEENREFKKRLLVWTPNEGWEPICHALNLPVPNTPFPHRNRRTEYHGY